MLQLLTILLLALATAPATPGPTGTPLADPDAVASALASAEPPATLPGNSDATIELATWEAFYGNPLADTVGAWVMTGSNQLPIVSVILFGSPDNAEAGLGEFRRGSSEGSAGELDAWTIADRGKWICMAADGAAVIIGQAEPVTVDEDQDAVRDRACDVVVATHTWLLSQLPDAPVASPIATPGNGYARSRAGCVRMLEVPETRAYSASRYCEASSIASSSDSRSITPNCAP